MFKFAQVVLVAFLVIGALVSASYAQEDFSIYEKEYSAAKQAILEGHVKDGITRMAALVQKVDAVKEPNNFWILSANLAEFLYQLESYPEESQVLSSLLSTKISNSNPAFLQNMQLYVGRNLAYTGHADEAEKILRKLTGDDARWVHSPPQRAAARMLSTIELDRGNISQAAIWIRRAVVGAMVDKGSGSEEIEDTLTDYARYLRRTRQLLEAHDILSKLVPAYDQSYSHYSPKYLHFASEYLETLRAVGNFPAADAVYKILKENASHVDFVAGTVRAQLFYQDLYGAAAASPTGGDPTVTARLKDLSEQFPDLIKKADSRITLSYFSLLAGDLDLAEKFTVNTTSETLTDQFAAYELILRSYISARRNQFDASSDMLSDALEKINKFHHTFAGESASRLPTISLEERTVLSAILAHLIPHVSSPKQADLVFRLEQFLNRDKSKASLSAKVARQLVSSDLAKEDIRSRDRLKDLRERIMVEATQQLSKRTLPVKNYEPSKNNDYAFLIRLEEIEDKIITATAEANADLSAVSGENGESLLSVSNVQQLLKPDEGLVIHVVLPGKGIVATCITSDDTRFEMSNFAPSEAQQLVIDAKLVSAALRGTHEPSAELDSSFPADSSFRLYQATLGRLETCLKDKRQIFLATDADLIGLPWNALISERDVKKEYRNQEAAWLVRSYAISLLPSVGSLRQLRLNLPASEAKKNFLGIGDPDFRGQPERSAHLALGSLITRGVADRDAIRNLPRLPEAGVELKGVATALGASNSDILLGREATERGLRSRALEDYKVISFATHALVAGEIEGFAEPALILSPGDDDRNPKNDGLLTVNEIADLSLDANLVILSACNTAAPDGRINGRGLSGLADAFFFAGARAVAVTQWAVFSDAAQQIGTGLVSRSIGTNPTGVAEGLRRTMLDYIGSAKHDYLAHPRFWASYVIAGDGAVNPLQQKRLQTWSKNNVVQQDWEHISERREQSELLAITKTNEHRTNYSIGMLLPPLGEKRAGSYVTQTGEHGEMAAISVDSDMAAARIFSFGGEVGISGYYPASCSSCPQAAGNYSAVFKLLTKEGLERWKVIQQSPISITGLEMARVPGGYILIALETDHNNYTAGTSISLSLVSPTGALLLQNRIATPLTLAQLARGTVSTPDGNLVLAISGELPVSEKQSGPVWMSPLTGAKRFGCALSSVIMFSIDPKALSVRLQSESTGGLIASLKQADGGIFALVNFTKNCRSEKNIRLVEVDPQLSFHPLFETDSTSSVEGTDFEVTPNKFIVVGRIYSFLPSVLANETLSLEQLKNYRPPDVLDESIWDKGDSVVSAAVLVVGRNGVLLGDKVMHDVRNRSLTAIAARGDNHFVASGNVLGDRGWTIGFTVGDQLH